ncbi:MAG: HD domain-containing protein [Deltaproteobacteria bacterium]|jgi:hypothetical protein|nr:HD domain-containing protein [Deltaproteobacteria bacterium]
MHKKPNEHAARASTSSLEKEALAVALRRECAAFNAYALAFRGSGSMIGKHLELKYAHSLRVLQNAEAIAMGEDAFRHNPLAKRALLMAALYHDLGRFEQLARYQTFRDADSINHGLLGAKLLRDKRFLSEETPQLRRLVRAAVLWHNRLNLPQGAPEPLATVSKALRDADKIDIIGVLNEELHPGHEPDKTIVLELRNDPKQYSPKALEAVMAGRAVLYADMESVNDFRLLLCSWVFMLEFGSSLRLLVRNGYMENILASLPPGQDMNKVRARVHNRLRDRTRH